jgi:hypothetical protein
MGCTWDWYCGPIDFNWLGGVDGKELTNPIIIRPISPDIRARKEKSAMHQRDKPESTGKKRGRKGVGSEWHLLSAQLISKIDFTTCGKEKGSGVDSEEKGTS